MNVERRRRLVGFVDGVPVVVDEPVDREAARRATLRSRAMRPRSIGAHYRPVDPRRRLDLETVLVAISIGFGVLALVVFFGPT